MKWKVQYPALEGLTGRRDTYKGRLVLLSYNYGKQAWRYPCGHATDEVRVYRCPPELLEQAERLGILAQSVNKPDLIVFDPQRIESGVTCRVIDKCPRCLFADLLARRPSCAVCGSPISVKDCVILKTQSSVRRKLMRADRDIPATAMTVMKGGKTFFVGCVNGECAKDIKDTTRAYFFEGKAVSYTGIAVIERGSFIRDGVGSFYGISRIAS